VICCSLLSLKASSIWRSEESLYSYILSQESSNIKALFNLGSLYDKQQNFELAEQEYKKAEKILIQNLEFFYNKLKELYGLDADIEKIQHIQNALDKIQRGEVEHLKEDLSFKKSLFETYDKTFKLKDELEYQRMINIFLDLLKRLYFRLGSLYLKQNKLDLSWSYCTKSLLIFPDSPYFKKEEAGMHYNLGVIYYMQNEYKKALSEYTQALEKNPNYKETYNNLGILYMELKQPEKAETSLRKAIQINDQYFLPYKNLIKFYISNNHTDKADEIIQKGLNVFKGSSEEEYFQEYIKKP